MTHQTFFNLKLTCKGWKKSIYGKNYEDNFFTSTVPLNQPFVNYNQPFNNNNNHNNYNKKPGDDYDNKEYFYSQETTMYSGELLRTFNLMPTTSSNYELVNTHSIITKRPLTKKKTKQFTTIPTTTSTTTTTSTFKIDTSTTTISTKLTSIKFKPRTKLKTSTASTTHKHSPVTLQSQTTTSLTSDNKYSLIVSSFLEKLRNLEQTAPDKSVAELPKQNYTILTATGKKTVLVPGDKPKFDLNETIVERLNYLAEIYSKKINNTKLMNQIEIIKNIFALKNRDTTATSTILAKTSSTTLSPITLKALINEENASTAASNEDSSDMTKQFDAYFDGLETSTILQTVTNVNIKENLDSYYDESYEDSLENEDLSILDSDLLLNLQLNTFSTNPNKLNAKILAPSHDLTQQLKGNDETDESQSEEDGEGGGGGGSGGSSEMVLNAVANQNSLKSSVAGFYSQKFTILNNFLTFSVYVYYESSF